MPANMTDRPLGYQVATDGIKRWGRRRDIQGLRMIAVLAVIADHVLQWPTGGFVGVDVFFVISGFLITSLLLREHDKTGVISFWGFYRRRLKRILPAAMLVIVVTVSSAFLLYNKVRFEQTFFDAVWATIFGANWHFAIQGTDYFGAEAAVSPLQHYWSLSVEEQFYLVWPWLMLFIFWLVGRMRDSLEHARGAVFAAIAVITACSFSWAMWESVANPTFAYFSTFSRAWELGLGAMIAVISPRLTGIVAWLRTALAWAGLIGVAVSLFVVTETEAFPAPWALLPVVSTGLVLLAGTGGEPRFLWPITNRVSDYLGDISYSLYLWHFPVAILLMEVMEPGTIFYAVTALGIIGVASVASFDFVEDPVRRSSWLEPPSSQPRKRKRRGTKSKARTRRKYIALAAFAVVDLVLVLVLLQPGSNPMNSVAAPAPNAPNDLNAETSPDRSQMGASLAELQAKIAAANGALDWPSDLSPRIDELATIAFDTADARGCAPAHPQGKDCASITTADPKQTVVVVGNSVAIALLPTIRAVFEPLGWNVVALTMAACSFVEGDTKNDDTLLEAACPGHKEIAVQTIKRLRPALVIASHLYGAEFRSNDEYMNDFEHWAAAVPAMIERISPFIGAYIALSAPPWGKDPAECAGRFSSPADCRYEVTDSWRSYAALENRIISGENRYFINTVSWFCNEELCPAFVDRTLVKRDASHMTPQYAELLAPILDEEIDRLGVNI